MPSIYKVDPTDVETFTVVTNPIRTYTSSSIHGATGSVYLFARRSKYEKDAGPDSSFVETTHDDSHIAETLRHAQYYGRNARRLPASGSWSSGSYSSGSYTTGSWSSGSYSSGSYASGSWSSGSWTGGVDYSGSYVPTGTFTPEGVFNPTGSFMPGGVFTPTGTFVPSGDYRLEGEFTPSGPFVSVLRSYIDKVNSRAMSRRKQQLLDVIRFRPPPTFNSNTLRKLVVKDMLQTYYRTSYPTAHWAYTNYNALNFFTASTVPTSSVMLYPNIDGGRGDLVVNEGHVSGTYVPSGSFSFDFYINPRYTTDSPDGHFKAGTILHLSSTYALSLVTGSSKDPRGRPVGFRLQLQLSHSADVAPSAVKPNGNRGQAAGRDDLIFLSDDNSLWLNNWHHVVVRWGTRDVNAGVGTFNIDRVDRGTFNVPSSTIAPLSFSDASLQLEPAVLCLGNYYEGPNRAGIQQAQFFAIDPATRDGLQVLTGESPIEEPSRYAFQHPLNAELHDVAIRRCYLSDRDIAFSASRGPTYLDNTFAFYVPPFFVEESPYRQFVGDHGGVMLTPFQEVDGATKAPFSVALSFGVDGHYINLENFVRDFASNVFPRLHHLTGVAIADTTTARTCNEFLYDQSYVVKRNLTVLPCDDGLFVPSFQLLASETLARAVDDLGIEEMSFINLNDMVMSSTMLFGPGVDSEDGSFADLQMGHTPERPFANAGPAFVNYSRNLVSGSDVEAAAPLAVYQRTQDGSSNQVTFFDISNMFYGFRMKPGTLSLRDRAMSGSGGAVKITLADDGRGNVYRADCFTSHSTWNSVGNIYYDEGIVVLKSPHVYFFGQEQYDLNFRGEQHVHVMKVDAFAPNNQLNSSSNPNFISVPPSGFPNDPESEFVYITGLNFHDKDYNVVLKTTLAQPISKRTGDKVLFKVKYDW